MNLAKILSEDNSYPAPVIVELPENPNVAPSLLALQDAAISALPLKQIERLYARYVVERCGGNLTQAARQLGIDRRTIQRWAREDGYR